MERRSFVKGLFGGVTAAGAVILTATPSEIQQFASKTAVGQPIVSSVLESQEFEFPDVGMIVFDAEGRALGIVRDYQINRPMVSAGFDGRGFEHVVPGLASGTMTISLFGPATSQVVRRG